MTNVYNKSTDIMYCLHPRADESIKRVVSTPSWMEKPPAGAFLHRFFFRAVIGILKCRISGNLHKRPTFVWNKLKRGEEKSPPRFFMHWTAKIRQKFKPKYRILTIIIFMVISWPRDKIEKILM